MLLEYPVRFMQNCHISATPQLFLYIIIDGFVNTAFAVNAYTVIQLTQP